MSIGMSSDMNSRGVTITRAAASSPMLETSTHAKLTLWSEGNQHSKRSRREVIQTVAVAAEVGPHLLEQNPQAEKLWWKFVVFGQYSNDELSAPQWVGKRMQRVGHSKQGPPDVAHVLCDFSAAVPETSHGVYTWRREKQLKIKGSQVSSGCTYIVVVTTRFTGAIEQPRCNYSRE